MNEMVTEELFKLIKVKNLLKESGCQDGRHWRELARRFQDIGAESNTEYCNRRAEYCEKLNGNVR